ncbi:hypothetical protein GX50_04250 [[Emmonsia] crescens]|uniref:SUN domain-containing protein n=1 Tax=[Emmonsia] crescens TaxID=73230 RepID=A0A2B7ZIH7_9EURO|nr:hypothetical protein GX50_04250 [Emmonsia crescens]
MTGRKSASTRSGSRAPNTRPTRAAPTANAAAAAQVDQTNPDLGNPSLPDVRTQQSFAYGSTKTPALPRQLEIDPSMGLSEMVDTLDDGLRQAQDRDLARVEEPTHPDPEKRQTRSMSVSIRSSMSPAPEPASRRTPSRKTTTRSKTSSRRAVSRQPTPEDQLLESLREVSEETEDIKREDDASVSALPDTPSVNGSASVSWTTERAIHGTLPREINTGTRPNYYLRDPYGSRPSSSQGPSGLSLPPTRGPIFEEPFRANPPLPPPINAPRVPISAAIRRTLPPVPAFNNQQRDQSASKSSASSASSSSSRHTPSSSSHSSPALAAVTPAGINFTSSQRVSGIAKTPPVILVTIGLILAAILSYFCRDHACAFPQGLQTRMSHYFCSPTSSFTIENSTTMYSDAFHKLSYHVDQRLSDMAKDVAALKNEWNKRLPHLKEALSRSPAATTDPLTPPKVNYASVGMGAVVDPYLTSPTMATSAGLVSRIGQYLAKVPRGSPPVAALQPWDGVGECWCAATRSNVSQLTILLGRAIVPEEVVIEHIPKGATLDAGSAPREMELWVQYTARPPTAAAAYPPGSGSSIPSPPSPASSPQPPSSSPSSSPGHPSHSPHHLFFSWLRDTILTTLRQVYPDEPASAYSDDALLGPSFFRVGRWQYNIDGGHHIQPFKLDAVIDMPAARVEKVVFRVKSNWGAAHTCLYRVRLHGHL